MMNEKKQQKDQKELENQKDTNNQKDSGKEKDIAREKEQEYHFLKEVIKEEPVQHNRIIRYLIAALFLGVVIGVTAAAVFVRMLPHFEKEEATRVNLSTETEVQNAEDSTDSSSDSSETPVGDKQQDPNTTATEEDGNSEQKETEPVDEREPTKRELDLEDYEKLYGLMQDVVKEAEKSLVSVQGITSSVDWMNNSYENARQISGLIVADTGKELYILTEYRVVDKVDRILVTFQDGTSVDAHFQKCDTATGLAVLHIDRSEIDKETRKTIVAAKLGNSALVEKGDPVIAIGNPTGYSNSLASGIATSVSNYKTVVDGEYHLLATDILGSSEGSGILLNLDGEVIGILNQSMATGNKDVVVCLPISEISSLIEKLSNKEDLIYLGVSGQDVGSDPAQKTGIPKGIYVTGVEEDSPAMQAGIQNGDVIEKVNGNTVETLTQLRKALDKCTNEGKITVSAMRKGAQGYVEITFDVTVTAL